jgi:hypothetical protein
MRAACRRRAFASASRTASWSPSHLASPSPEEAGCEPPLAVVHAPFMTKGYKGYKTMGLQGVPPQSWLQVDGNLESDLREKAAILRDHRDRFLMTTPSSLPAQHELAALLASNLAEHHSGSHGGAIDLSSAAREGSGAPPIEWASSLVSEDLCVLEKQQDEWVFTAGSVCFPTYWSLPDKIGHGVQAVHAPVPGFAERLAPTVNKFFDKLAPGSVTGRANWSLLRSRALSLPGLHSAANDRSESSDEGEASPSSEIPSPPPEILESNAGHELWLRVERQTIQKMPQSGAIAFTIRIHRCRLERLVEGNALAATRLRDAVTSLRDSAPAMFEYKSLPAIEGPLLAYLEGATDRAAVASTIETTTPS